MKNLILLIISLISVDLLFGQQPGEEQWKENLSKNHVQTQVQWNHKYEKGNPRKDGYKNYMKRFDHKGNVIEEVYYQSDSVDQRLSYRYDNKENKVEYVNYLGNGSKVLFKQNITYDNAGKKIREERYNGSDYQIIKYNYENNKLSEIIRSNIYGNVEHKRTFKYTGNICTIDIINEKGQKTGEIRNKYDDNNNIIESTEYDIKGKVKEKYLYEFEGNLVQEKVKYVLGNFIYKEEYEYGNNGNLIKVIKKESEGKQYISNIYKYDAQGNLIEEEWYDNHPKDNSTKKYFYDEKGLLEKVEVYYALYRYKIQYRYDYTFY